LRLQSGCNRLGRAESNEFRLDHSSVAPAHCEVWLMDEEVLVRDLGAATGTLIDGQPVKALVDVELATAFGLVGGFGTAIQVPAGTVVVRGSLIVARGKSYKVTRPPHDNHGVLTLELTAA